MDSKRFLADFQILANRVLKFNFNITGLNIPECTINLSYDIDYHINNVENKDNKWFGIEELVVTIQGKVEEEPVLNIELVMEGIFVGDASKLDEEKFIERMELNGLANLSHLSRAYIHSVTALSGMNPPLQLPMFNVISLIKMKKIDKE